MAIRRPNNMPAERDQRDLVLDQSQYALVLTETKGTVIPYVGPTKTNLDTTDSPVRFNALKRTFERVVTLEEAIRNFPRAEEGSYIVLENPADDGSHPGQGAGAVQKLSHGRKINIPGPTTFPLYPGQVAKVIQGHQLRSNQYLIVRVYNEDEAKKNWNKSILKPAALGEEKTTASKEELTIGKLLIIKGTEASFYIPSNGFEVLPDIEGNYVRDAVTLERLEFAILLEENGNKDYRQGPDVVFPEPTQTFIEKENKKKFRALELNAISGIHIKVIADYEEGSKKFKAGDEIFITGKDQSIYYPRPEHAVIKYGDQEVHYATAIPAGEARYELDRLSGEITKVVGPAMYLPDPRTKVMIRRILDEKTVQLWYPGNSEALAVNRELSTLQRNNSTKYISSNDNSLAAGAEAMIGAEAMMYEKKLDYFAGDEIERKTSYTPPRCLTIDTKYEGVPRINVWTGYAIMLVNQKGERRVVKGPATILPEYDEYLESMSLSTGKPKNTDNIKQTAYLRIIHNKVSDIVEDVETKDLCKLGIKVSYRVNFVGDEKKWFDIENYIKLLCDHFRSKVKSAAKHFSIEQLYLNTVDFVRDTLLGKKENNKDRPGKTFENGMRVYDIEVLDVKIKDKDIEEMLIENQKNVVAQNLKIAKKRKEKDTTIEEEKINQELERARIETSNQKAKLVVISIGEQLKAELAEVDKDKQVEIEKENIESKVEDIKLIRDQKKAVAQQNERNVRIQQDIARMKAEVDSYVEKAQAINPHLVQALQAFGDKLALESVCKSMSPLAILGGESVSEVIQRMLKGTGLSDSLNRMFNGGSIRDND